MQLLSRFSHSFVFVVLIHKQKMQLYHPLFLISNDKNEKIWASSDDDQRSDHNSNGPTSPRKACIYGNRTNPQPPPIQKRHKNECSLTCTYLRIQEEFIPGSLGKDDVDVFRRHHSQNLRAQHEHSEDGEQRVHVDHLPVRPEALAEGHEDYHPDDGQVEGQLEFDGAVGVSGSQVVPLEHHAAEVVGNCFGQFVRSVYWRLNV